MIGRTIRILRRRRPHLYFRLFAALPPQEYRIREVDFSDIADQETQQILDMLKEAIKEKQRLEAGRAVADEPDVP